MYKIHFCNENQNQILTANIFAKYAVNFNKQVGLLLGSTREKYFALLEELTQTQWVSIKIANFSYAVQQPQQQKGNNLQLKPRRGKLAVKKSKVKTMNT